MMRRARDPTDEDVVADRERAPGSMDEHATSLERRC
jgi:hypothetical protein